MKAKLAAGEPALGVSVMFASPQVVEMLGAFGFDWVLLDCEHGAMSLPDLEAMAMAAKASGMTPIARPATKSPEHIAQALDRGVLGVQVPHVITAEDARSVVQAVKYHPLGRRGLAAGTRSANYDAHGSMADYVREANEATLIAAQIEDEAALANLDDLLAVKEIDVFFIGPSDLSQSMGHPGNAKAPRVAQAIDACLQRIRAAGRTAGMPSGVDNLAEVLGKGARYVYTHVPRLLAAASRSYLASPSSQRS
jgi:4-hydroxy-2-oxoheptanedioate aldolase